MTKKLIDFTKMKVGTTTTKITEGKMNRTIQKCPYCGKNGAYVKYLSGDRAYTHTANLEDIKSGDLTIRTLTIHEHCFVPKTFDAEK